MEVNSRIVPGVGIHRQKLVEKINNFKAADLGQIGKETKFCNIDSENRVKYKGDISEGDELKQ